MERTGISQRDTNHYEFLNEPETQRKIVSSFVACWTAHVKPKWTGPASCKSSISITCPWFRVMTIQIDCSCSLRLCFCTDALDVLLTRDQTRFHIIDFNPYAPRTDALLFTYEELATLFTAAITSSSPAPAPMLRVIDSPTHPAATRNAPQHQHNMVPLEALTLSEGRNMEEFAATWIDQVRQGAVESDEDGEV